MEGEAPRVVASTEQQPTFWDEAERKLWHDFEQGQNDIYTALENAYNTATTEIKFELGVISSKRTQLVEMRDRLMKEKCKVDADLERLAQEYNEKITSLAKEQHEHLQRNRDRSHRQDQIIRAMQTFFQSRQGMPPRTDLGSVPQPVLPNPHRMSNDGPHWRDPILNLDEHTSVYNIRRATARENELDKVQIQEGASKRFWTSTPPLEGNQKPRVDYLKPSEPLSQTSPSSSNIRRISTPKQAEQQIDTSLSPITGSNSKPFDGIAVQSRYESTRRSFGATSGTPSNRGDSLTPSPGASGPLDISGSLPKPTSQLAAEPCEDITQNNLVLRHDGNVYTYPELVAGVPLAKIDEDHPYWEPGWKPLKPEIEAQLAAWREKCATTVDGGIVGERGTAISRSKRQVQRGIKVLEFLEHGSISPYQLVSKKYIRAAKGSIISYDTLFRLCETLSELSRFKLDVTPVEWMRHRLHEIMVERGTSFNVATVVHNFYHDPKLMALRTKNGLGSVGRPSGYQNPRGSRKRKGMHSQDGISSRVSPPIPESLYASVRLKRPLLRQRQRPF